MDQLIKSFPAQLEEAIEIGKNANIRKPKNEIRNILVSGLGGSGIGGNLVKELSAIDLNIPFEVNKDYFLPNYVDEHTLVIISSYSGNTEETLNAFELALDRDAHIVCISSGGKVIEIAKEHHLDYIQLPGGMPPRACLGYSFVQQLFVLMKLNYLPEVFEKSLVQAVDFLNQNQETFMQQGKELAEFLFEKTPVIYISAHLESVAVRFRQQINENSKMLCWHHAIPEMNHNELVGWRNKDENLAVVFFRTKDDYERTIQRMEINKKIISEYTPSIRDFYASGKNLLEQALSLIHIGDWASVYLAEMRGMDAVEVNVIDYLKGELAKK